MSVSGKILQATDDLAPLKELAEIIKDPQKIVEAHEIARAQEALTDEVRRQAVEAKEYIARHADLLKDIDRREASLGEKADALAKQISDFAAEKEQQAAIYVEQSKVIAAGNEALREAKQAFDKDRKTLNEEMATLAREKAEILERIRKEKEQILADRAFVAEERGKLDKYATELRAKAANIREIAGS